MSDIFRDYSFGGQLHHLRIERRITLRAISEASGIDAAKICRLENSEAAPPDSRKKCEILFDKLEINEEQRPWLVSLAQSFHLGKVQERFTDNDA